MYCSVRPTVPGSGPPLRNSPIALLKPPIRFFRIRKSVYPAPTSIPPTAIGRTM